MSVSGILGWLNIRGVTVGAELPDEIYCGLDTLVTVHLENEKKRFPLFLLKVRILGETVAFDLLGGGAKDSISFMYRFRERGEHVITLGEISSPFPINFFVRSRWLAVNRRVIVFPAPLPCPMPAGYDATAKDGAQANQAKGYEGDVSKIGEYTGFEPLKLVHWRLTAKHGTFKVKELTAASQEPIILDLHLLPGKSLEENLSCAVYLINLLVKKNRLVGLQLNERLLPPAASRAHRLLLLSELALYGKN
jgi:uncharacterized protein (DUF58 family)